MKYINKNRILGMDIRKNPLVPHGWSAIIYLETTEYTKTFGSKNHAKSYLEDIVLQANSSLFVYLGE